MEMGEEERVRALAVHNLSVSFAEVRAVRQAIRDESLWSHAAMRASSHPDLMAAYRHLLTWADRLEEYEPQSRKSEFVSTPWDVGRPAFVRYRRRVKERTSTPDGWPVVPIREGAPPVREQGVGRVVFHCPIGYIPWTLDQIYPAGLTMLPGNLPLWRQPAEACLDLVEDGEIPADDLQRVRSVCEYQFGRDLADLLLAGEIKIAVSRTSGRIRTVHVDGAHILSMRNDGFFTLKPEGARRIVEGTEPPRMRVVVDPDSAPFNRKGRNVFCGFVVSVDEGIGLMEEVIVVDRGDEVLAVGRAVLTGSEMTRFEKGLAVKVRQGVDQKGGEEDGGEGE